VNLKELETEEDLEAHLVGNEFVIEDSEKGTKTSVVFEKDNTLSVTGGSNYETWKVLSKRLVLIELSNKEEEYEFNNVGSKAGQIHASNHRYNVRIVMQNQKSGMAFKCRACGDIFKGCQECNHKDKVGECMVAA